MSREQCERANEWLLWRSNYIHFFVQTKESVNDKEAAFPAVWFLTYRHTHTIHNHTWRKTVVGHDRIQTFICSFWQFLNEKWSDEWNAPRFQTRISKERQRERQRNVKFDRRYYLRSSTQTDYIYWTLSGNK